MTGPGTFCVRRCVRAYPRRAACLWGFIGAAFVWAWADDPMGFWRVEVGGMER